MKPYSVQNSQRVFEGRLSSVRVDQVRMPDGSEAEREIIEHPDAVAVVPIDDQGRVVLVRQYRHALRSYLMEIPAGKLDHDGESPEDTARRELTEEVGLAADALLPLVRFHNSSGWTDESTTVYLATGLREAKAAEGFSPAHEEADMQVLHLPLAEAAGMAQRGEIADAKTLIGLLLAAAHLA